MKKKTRDTRIRKLGILQRAREMFLAFVTLALVAGLLGVLAPPAQAAAGDYNVEITAPESVPVRQGFAYAVTIDSEPVVSGAELTVQLPPGVTLDSVPTGPDSPVESYTYDAATGKIVFKLKDLNEPLSSFVFSVKQDQDQDKDDNSSFETTITGSETSSGNTPSDSAVTDVTGDWKYSAAKSASSIVGSGNRDVRYTFNISGNTAGQTFSSWAQQLTDTLPAGAIITGTSSAPGAWVTTENPDGTTTAVWTRDGAYGPGGTVDPSGSQIWLTVRYPADVFPEGSLPPKNTVDLKVKDKSGDWHDGSQASVQSPELGQGDDKQIYISKMVQGRAESTLGNGAFLSNYEVKASYLNTLDDEKLDNWVITDPYVGNEDFWDHVDEYRLSLSFNPVLKSTGLDYQLSYTTNVRTTWQNYELGNTKDDLRLVTQVEGSTGFVGNEGFNKVLNLKAGERLTGWKLELAPGEGLVPSGSEVAVKGDFPASFPSLKDGSAAKASMPNTASATATLERGGQLEPTSATAKLNVIDRVPIITGVVAPKTLEVGKNAVYEARVANEDPSGRSYKDSVMKVVLPAGVVYDSSVGISPVNAVTPVSGLKVPTEGNGLTVSTETIMVDGVEHQVVIFTFAELESARETGTPKNRQEMDDAMRYNIPVRVLPQAYNPAVTQVPVESWAYTNDPVYSKLLMEFWSGYYKADKHDFSATLATIAGAAASSSVITSGGLLIGKSVRTDENAGWGLSTEADSPGTAQWQVYMVNALPNPTQNVVIFDRLPVQEDGRGTQFQLKLDGAASVIGKDAVVEYSTDATTATTGTWTTSPEGATAVRVSKDVLAPGESLTINLSTQVPAGISSGHKAVNDATGTGLYGGSNREFSSNRAEVTIKTPETGALTWFKVDSDGKPLEGSEWKIVGPDTSNYTVADNGENDEDPALGALKISNLPVGEYSLEETKAPEGYELSKEKFTATLTATQLEATFGKIVNNLITPPTTQPPTTEPPTTQPPTTEPPTTQPPTTVVPTIETSAKPSLPWFPLAYTGSGMVGMIALWATVLALVGMSVVVFARKRRNNTGKSKHS